MTAAYIFIACALSSLITSLIYIGLALLSNRNHPIPHQDTDSQSAISAGDSASIHNGANT